MVILQKNLKFLLKMACILHIETSTDVCSVAVTNDRQLIWNEEDHSGPNHAVSLGVYVDQALSYIDHDGLKLDAVAVSSGPGSYTGLRIGVSMAKGVCYGRDAVLISAPTLQVLCVPILFREDLPEDAVLCPMIDARRMEVYSAIYDRALKEVRPVQADVVTEETYKEYLDKGPVWFFGNGAAKCKEVINHPNAKFIDNIQPLAKNICPVAQKRLYNNQTEDVAYFEPNYLKEFQATKAKTLL